MRRTVELGRGMPPVTRLGLATRGNTHPTTDDVLYALTRGINYWNWCGHDDGMSQAVRELGTQRNEIVLATQLRVPGWSKAAMHRALEHTLEQLQTDYLDVVTLYYVESEKEWSQITAEKEGALFALQEAKTDGRIKAIGLTTHQRPLAAEWVASGLLDLLMIRYNAAHRKAESQVLPLCEEHDVPVVCFTCLRWGALLQSTDEDPSDFRVPPAPEWYRFVLSHPAVGVALTAPDNRRQLLENLRLLDDWRPLTPSQMQEMKRHGDRVRQTAGPFP